MCLNNCCKHLSIQYSVQIFSFSFPRRRSTSSAQTTSKTDRRATTSGAPMWLRSEWRTATRLWGTNSAFWWTLWRRRKLSRPESEDSTKQTGITAQAGQHFHFLFFSVFLWMFWFSTGGPGSCVSFFLPCFSCSRWCHSAPVAFTSQHLNSPAGIDRVFLH